MKPNNKYLFTIIGVLLVTLIYLIVCYFSPKTMNVKNTLRINCSKSIGFLMLNDVREWKNWLSWKNIDPTFKFSVGGRFTNIGASFTFDGSKFGKGQVYLEEAYKDSVIVSYIKNNNWPSDVSTYWQLIPESKNSLVLNVNSRLQQKIPFLQRPFFLHFEENFSTIQQADLDSLKSYLEKLVNSSFGIKSGRFDTRKYVGIKMPIPNYKMQKFYSENYPKLYQFLDSIKVEPSGPPVGMVYGWDGVNSIVDLMAALPVPSKVKVPLGFEYIEIPTTPCIKLEHYGFYNTLKNAHAKMDYVMNNSSFVLQSPIIEEYVTSPSKEPDTSKWLTNIYYLLENKGAYAESVKKKTSLEELVEAQENQRKQKLGLKK